MYIFLITERGDRTNICSNIKLVTLQTLIDLLNNEIKLSWRTQIRVGKVDDKNFQTRILKYINLKEFEEIFKGHIEDIKSLLIYSNFQQGIFKKEILQKYGIKGEY